MLIFYYKLIIF